jgi:hypothetical protein
MNNARCRQKKLAAVSAEKAQALSVLTEANRSHKHAVIKKSDYFSRNHGCH